jgi:hypothetical protein
MRHWTITLLLLLYAVAVLAQLSAVPTTPAFKFPSFATDAGKHPDTIIPQFDVSMPDFPSNHMDTIFASVHNQRLHSSSGRGNGNGPDGSAFTDMLKQLTGSLPRKYNAESSASFKFPFSGGAGAIGASSAMTMGGSQLSDMTNTMSSLAQQAMVDQAHGATPPIPTGVITPDSISTSIGSTGADAVSFTVDDMIAPSPEPSTCAAPDFECQVSGTHLSFD